MPKKVLRDLIEKLNSVDPNWGDAEGILNSDAPDETKEALLSVVLGLAKRRARGEPLVPPHTTPATAPPWYYDPDDLRYPWRQPDYPVLGSEHPLQIRPPEYPRLGGEHPLWR